MSEPALLDTNVLVYALYEGAEHHSASRALLRRAEDAGATLCVSPQTAAEFYAVVTDGRRVTHPKTATQALEALEAILSLPGVTLLPVPGDVFHRLARLLRQIPVTGGRVFDVQLAATMLGNGVRRIYTFDAKDFEAFDAIEVIRPGLPGG